MRRCILHIGMHKTGSSSIQASLKDYASRDFRYARLLRTPNHSGAIIQAFSKASRNQWKGSDHPLYGQEDIAERTKERLEKQLRRTKADTLIVSGEGISGLKREELEDLKKFIEKYASETVVACYVRAPKSYMESAAQQRIKAGLEAFEFEAFYPSYRGRFEKFDQVFGHENVKFWMFNPKSFKNHCVVSDFCAHFDIKIPPSRIVRVNESLSLDALSLLYSYHKHTPSSAELITEDSKSYAALIKCLAELKGAKFKLASEVTSPVLEKNRDDTKWMESRLGESLGDANVSVSDKLPIAVEDDLLSPSDMALRWLSDKVEVDYSHFDTEDLSLTVARYMHQLRQDFSTLS